MDAINSVPRSVLQTLVDGFPGWNEIGVDRLHALAGNQAQRSVAGSGHEVKAAFVHEGHHFVRSAGGFHIDLATGRLFKLSHPVEGLVGCAALDVARPGHNIDLTFAFSDFLFCLLGEGQSTHGGHGKQRQNCMFQSFHRFVSLYCSCLWLLTPRLQQPGSK